MEKNNIFDSHLFRAIIIGLGVFIILVFIFGLGVFVGTKRAEFAFQWAEEYHQNFGGPQGGIFGNFMNTTREFSNANGSYGTILKIDGNTITVKDNDGDNTEKSILTDSKTIIIYQRKNIKLSDLKIGENIVVIGQPNSSGQIDAELIRVMTSVITPTIQNTSPNLNLAPNSSQNNSALQGINNSSTN